MFTLQGLIKPGNEVHNMPEITSTYEPLVLVNTADLPEDEWLEYRRRGIGGSDAAAILGVSPFATARDLYYDKLKVISYEDGESNWVAKKVGHLLEDATTVHKAMGSEFDIVIMPILRSHYIMLNRNIVYTAITRAREQVIPVGQKKTLIMAILKKTTGKRNTLLGERIGKYHKAFARQNELKMVS